MDLLLLVLWTALGLVAGAALGYLLGVRQERHKTHNAQQMRAVAEIREKVRELQRDFWSGRRRQRNAWAENSRAGSSKAGG